MRTLTIIDTFGFFFRSYYALPPLKNSAGFPTGLLLGFANLIHNLYKEGSSDYLVFALEGEGQNYRKEFYPQYKGTRQETPQELLMQLPIAIEWIKKMGFNIISFENYEADDAIASLSHWATQNGHNVRIISHDKDLYQLINDQVHLYDPIKKREIHQKECFEKWGVYPSDFIHLQSLIGDTTDNVPGIKGIGLKTAQKLINHYHTLDALYADIDNLTQITTKRLAQLVIDGKEEAYLSQRLVTLKTDLVQDFNPIPVPTTNPLLAIVDEIAYYEFERLSLKIRKQSPFGFKKEPSRNNGQKKTKFKDEKFDFIPHLLTSYEEIIKLLDSHPKDSPIAYDCETDSLDIQNAKMIGFSFCLDGKNGYYVPIAHNYLGAPEQLSQEKAKLILQKLFSFPLIGHNIKFDSLIAKNNFELTPQNEILDSMILAWLYDSSSHVGLDKQMFKWFEHKMISFDSIVQKGENFSQVHLESASKYASEDAVATYRLYYRLKEELETQNLGYFLDIAKTLEFPLIKVLAGMEDSGIKIDVPFFEKLRAEASTLIAEYSSQIYSLANEDFNLNSPQQLAIILFEKLGLKGSKRVKGGYSTEEKVLESLIDEHPIIPVILKYREANKLKSTYIDPLLKLCNQEHKIFTSFLQTGTATGRLSSKSPNLQNIPVRTEAGRKIRQGFIAQDGNVLLSVDYSQIELRLLAHFSQDSKLVEAFQEGKDIHAETAMKIFGECDEHRRNIAKTINFGLLYGMGSKKLSESLKIPQKEAKQYIESYFATFPTIKSFLKEQEENILTQGYSQTLLGHRRYFDFTHATDFQKSNFLREGINTIFQGSAADLIKLAMLEIDKCIQNTSVKMLLQVHDELIFELPQSEAQEWGEKIAKIMNGIYTLNIPLECGICIGKNWAELK